MKGGACALVRPLLREACENVAHSRAGIVERADLAIRRRRGRGGRGGGRPWKWNRIGARGLGSVEPGLSAGRLLLALAQEAAEPAYFAPGILLCGFLRRAFLRPEVLSGGRRFAG